ncbi:MAG: hypothetical protein M1569_02350 [Candidatus Marsarchaeota archaeon]|nr:hypothetical protein [Candidatus Marsarchaeota archaeon]
MMYWATHRNLQKDIALQVHAEGRINEIESLLPNGIAFTAYTAFKKIYGYTPSDYSEVYVYATASAIKDIRNRFCSGKGFSNLFVLETDQILSERIRSGKMEKNSVPIPQAFVDLWNIRSWYAKNFSDAISKKIFGD